MTSKNIHPYSAPKTLLHGGAIIQAAENTGIPIEQWADLSTGINPNGWPVPPIPPDSWQRLPEPNDGLELAVQHYYSSNIKGVSDTATNFTVTAGSQAAIQLLPQLFPKGVVWVPDEGYAEHPYWWDFYQHQVFFYSPEALEQVANGKGNTLPFDTLLIINPNNPTTQLHSKAFLKKLLSLVEQQQKRLIIDEAFLDTQPEHSMLEYTHNQHLVVLRSLGKFFGLAGIRCGLLFSHPTLLQAAQKHLGPWQIATPSRWVASQALTDQAWQDQAVKGLRCSSSRLRNLLGQHLATKDIISISHNDFFSSILFSSSTTQDRLYNHLLNNAILVRKFTPHLRIRVGLPKNENEWEKLTLALKSLK